MFQTKRRFIAKVGDKVSFQEPVKVREGKVVRIDGAYIYVMVKINGEKVIIERYMNELEPLEKFSK